MSSAAAKRTPAQVLHESRRRDSAIKRDRVFRSVDQMQRADIPITFANVAREARVSQWLVYADGVREYIDAAREKQASGPRRNEQVGLSASEASLRTDLALVREQNRSLRTEVARLKRIIRERLGAELDSASSETLRQRVDELSEANQRYRSENLTLRGELERCRGELQGAQDDLAAARTSLRRMIREQST